MLSLGQFPASTSVPSQSWGSSLSAVKKVWGSSRLAKGSRIYFCLSCPIRSISLKLTSNEWTALRKMISFVLLLLLLKPSCVLLKHTETFTPRCFSAAAQRNLLYFYFHSDDHSSCLLFNWHGVTGVLVWNCVVFFFFGRIFQRLRALRACVRACVSYREQ